MLDRLHTHAQRKGLVNNTAKSEIVHFKEKKRKTTQAVKTLPASIKEKRIPRAEALCNPFTKRNKKEVNGDQEGYQQ
eukprot:165724-Pelagomonas_calceolata.AAC.1